MAFVNPIVFVPHHVTTNFDSTSAFSDTSFQLAAHTDDDRGVCRLGYTVNQLFKVDLKPEHAEALKFIVNSRSRAWPHGTEVKKREQVVTC